MSSSSRIARRTRTSGTRVTTSFRQPRRPKVAARNRSRLLDAHPEDRTAAATEHRLRSPSVADSRDMVERARGRRAKADCLRDLVARCAGQESCYWKPIFPESLRRLSSEEPLLNCSSMPS